MTHPTRITFFDYMSVLADGQDIHPSSRCDAPLTGGCEQCQATITSHDAYFARFGTLRCVSCIGDDGFTTVADLELFRQTGMLPCTGCRHPVQPSEVSPDGATCTYTCGTCGTTAHYTMPTVT